MEMGRVKRWEKGTTGRRGEGTGGGGRRGLEEGGGDWRDGGGLEGARGENAPEIAG